MNWTRCNGLTIWSLAACLSLNGAGAFAQTSDAGAEAFLKSYYKAMSTAKGPKDLEPFLATEAMPKNAPSPEEEKMLLPFFVEMIKTTHPTDVKIIKTTELKDRVVFDMEPVKVPPAVEDMAKEPTFSMKGQAIVIREGDKWKVYKDYWTAEAKGKNGSSRMSFGTDPDKKDNDRISDASNADGGAQNADGGTQKNDPSSQLRDWIMGKWKQDGDGKAIYLLMKIMPDGKVSEINVRGEKPQQVAESHIRSLIESSQPLPDVSQEMKAKPYAWMVFDWSPKGRCISGPYFEETVPDWVLAKMGMKTPD